MSNSKRKRRSPEQVMKALAEGESMLAAGKSSAEVYQKLGVAESTWMRWKQQSAGFPRGPLTVLAAIGKSIAARLNTIMACYPLRRVVFSLPCLVLRCCQGRGTSRLASNGGLSAHPSLAAEPLGRPCLS